MSGSGNNNDNVRRTKSRGSNYRDSKEVPETKNVMKEPKAVNSWKEQLKES
jgi:hypothetical protein